MKSIQWRNLQTPLFVLVALGAGALSVTGMRGYISAQLAREAAKSTPPAMIELLVAKSDLPVGATLNQKSLALRLMPREFAPAQALSVSGFDGLVGRKLAMPVKAGDAVLEAMLEAHETPVFSSQLQTGARALSIVVDEVNSISGMLQPGDRIDLQLSVKPSWPQAAGASGNYAGNPAGALASEITTGLMADVRVLATGRQVRLQGSEAAARSFSSITVEVSPEQAQRLIVAQRSGRITALLRPRDDRSQVETKSLDLAGLLQVRTPSAAPAPRPALEIIVGGKGAIANPNSTSSPSNHLGGGVNATHR